MKVIIAGSRTFIDYLRLKQELDKIHKATNITEVVSGSARGADLLGERWAKENGVPVRRFLADWKGLGKYAGIARNNEMAAYADGLIAFWDGISKGTKNMIHSMMRLEKNVTVIRIDK